MKKVIKLRGDILEALKGKLDGFVLSGGTALSVYYFRSHRESYDLDFFAKIFARQKIESLMSSLSKLLSLKINLSEEQKRKDLAQMMVYYAVKDPKNSIKIDFVQDVHRIIKPYNIVNGIPVMSIEDIYLRKIYAICGVFLTADEAGKRQFAGGRQDAKDFFDLFYLSSGFMPLSRFAEEYCNALEKESLVVWHSRYDRLAMKTGLLEIRTTQEIDYRRIEKHFNSEIEKLIKEDLA